MNRRINNQSNFLIVSLFIILGLVLLNPAFSNILTRTEGNPLQNETQSKVGLQDDLEDSWWKKAASEMVDTQLISRGITDERVINVMRNIPRHLFVPKEVEKFAYADSAFPIGYRQTISQPYVVALMTELLALKGKEKVLEIGTGSGYQAAIISKLAGQCYSVEIIKELADRARGILKELGYKNVFVKWGDGYEGWSEHAPYDGIIITAAPENLPEKLIDQLKVGGKMVLPVGKFYQELVLITKEKKGYKREKIIPVQFVPMVRRDM